MIWLVVSTPLKNISQWEGLFPIYGKIKNVPNHQPVQGYTGYFLTSELIINQLGVLDHCSIGFDSANFTTIDHWISPHGARYK